MQQINTIFNPGPTKGTISFRFAHLWGKPGTGKTTLAQHYIQLHKDELSFVFWVWAESWETVAGSYLDFANSLVTHYSNKIPREKAEEQLGLTGVADMVRAKSALHLDKNRVMSVVRAVKDWLMQPENSKWLVVFDHVKPVYNVQEFIPLTLSGRVILTSRNEQDCTWGSKIPVSSMSEDQATEMLKWAANLSATETTEQGMENFPRHMEIPDTEAASEASELVRRLNCHPKSIAQAASAIRLKRVVVADYPARQEKRAVPTMFGSAIDQSPASRLVLRISVMLSASSIPVSLFLNSHPTVSRAVPQRFKTAVAELAGELYDKKS